MAPVIPAITTAIKKFSGKPLGVMSQALGVASVAAVVYDSHINGKERAVVTDEINSADRFSRQYNNYRMSDKQSATVSGLKKSWFDFQQNFSYYHPINKTKGYVGGFSKTVLNELPVIGLSAVALFMKNAVGKGAGILLAINAAKTLFCDVIGIGKSNKL